MKSGGSLDALTGLRFYAALHVVLFHFAVPCMDDAPTWLRHLVGAGYASVGVFFVLSGFVLAYNYVSADGAMRGGVRAFWSARLARVYPVFLLAFVLSAPPTMGRSLAVNVPATAALKLGSAGMATLLLLQAWVPKLALYWNPPGWSVAVEAFFYAVFPGLARRLRTPRGAGLVLALAGVWGLGLIPSLLYLWLQPDGPGPFDVYASGTWLTALKFSPLARLPEFLLGVMLGVAFVREREAATACSGTWMALAGAGLLVAGFAAGPVLPYPLMHNALLAPASGLLVYGLARGGGLLGRLLSRPLAVRLGGASYALYLLQYPVSEVVHSLESRLDLSSPWRWLGLLMVLLVPASLAVHHWVETPWRSRVRRALQPWVEADGAAKLSASQG
ncbi:acyltransferase [Corallococcus sp. M34]|uniref:acyltransferase family protein n=1 Tax=Citreicoccus inhibens TaxID=2849499 RepID=UPI001C22A7A2|nr:acyltransferase [Citreicoccus inhibens]MBU8896319.1 acyltransferase [Citreicoccus inhibens]